MYACIHLYIYIYIQIYGWLLGFYILATYMVISESDVYIYMRTCIDKYIKRKVARYINMYTHTEISITSSVIPHHDNIWPYKATKQSWFKDTVSVSWARLCGMNRTACYYSPQTSPLL